MGMAWPGDGILPHTQMILWGFSNLGGVDGVGGGLEGKASVLRRPHPTMEAIWSGGELGAASPHESPPLSSILHAW